MTPVVLATKYLEGRIDVVSLRMDNVEARLSSFFSALRSLARKFNAMHHIVSRGDVQRSMLNRSVGCILQAVLTLNRGLSEAGVVA